MPNIAMAEYAGYQDVEAADNKPPWYLGMATWRNTEIPVVSFELMNGEKFDLFSPTYKLAIINGVSGCQSPFYGIVTQGTPKMLQIERDAYT